jgi:GTPase SAR1 family protein
MSLVSMSEFKTSLRLAARRLENRRAPDPALSRMSRLLRRLHEAVERPLRIVVLGEANSGKTSVANLLIGADVAPTSALANTRRPVFFGYADRPYVRAVLENGGAVELDCQKCLTVAQRPFHTIEVGMPLERLRLIEVVDTPGTESAQMEIDAWDVGFRTGDMPIWCTVAAQAWKESERHAWSNLPAAARKSGILVVTRVDQLRDSREAGALRRRLEREVRSEFSAIVLLAVPDAMSASRTTGPGDADESWRLSGGEDLENALAAAIANNAEQRISRAKLTLQRAVAQRSTDRAITDVLPAELLPSRERVHTLALAQANPAGWRSVQ